MSHIYRNIIPKNEFDTVVDTFRLYSYNYPLEVLKGIENEPSLS